MANRQVDVFISGAGPVGLLLAYQLTRLGISVHIIDAADKGSPDFPMYGRACTLYPRSIELLDQMDLYDDMAQIAFNCRSGFTYNKGKKVQGRGWSIFEGWTGKTFFEDFMNLRLKYSEDVFREKLAGMGVHIQAPAKLETFELKEDAQDDYKIITKVSSMNDGTQEIRAKYIVGCDGGNSMVRKTAGIPFIGERHMDHWVRIDGVVKTNLPEARLGFGAIESPTHGQVLWVSLDHGATRIGYVLSPDLFEKYGTKMSAADAIKEARNAIAPFSLEFEEVHWHTVYGIQQHVAERFQDRERIFLAGEAAHTHSSGTAQGRCLLHLVNVARAYASYRHEHGHSRHRLS
jgi:phenol 2-monooxygenase (NADPH)